MGAPRKWSPGILTSADIIAGHLVTTKYGPNLDTENRVRADYQAFCKMNRLTREEGYELFIGQMINASLAAGTIKDYVEFVVKGDRGTCAYVAKKAVRALQGNTLTGHAPDITLATGTHIIEWAKKSAPESAEQLWLFLATGQRRVDIHRLKSSSVNLKRKKTLTIKWLWTKGIHRIQHRREIIFPIEDLPDAPSTLEHTLRSKSHPFECSVKKINETIAKSGHKATTGSFRRLFSHRIDEYCRKNGLQKMDMMLHQSASMVKAFYDFK